MQILTRADLYTLEAYAGERATFRARVLAHKKTRTLRLGDHVTLLFEDRLTVQYQVQEMLRIERIFEPKAIQQELDAYNPLIPDGDSLKATMLIGFPDLEQRRQALARLVGIEHALFAEVTGHGRARPCADGNMDRGEADKTSAVHFVRFEFTPAAVAALRGGAGLAFGIDDPRMPLRAEASETMRSALLLDFD